MGECKIRVRTTPGFWCFLALMVLLMPMQWLAAILLSSIFHELCHLAAIRITGASVYGLRLGVDGAYLETEGMKPFQGFVCALAGPLGALLLLLVARWMPRTALCAAFQSCYHLLPVHPLDGGRALRSLTEYFGWNRVVCTVTEATILTALALLGLYLTARIGLGLLPAVLSFAMIFRTCREKYLANRVRTGYNIPTKQKEVRL